MAKFMLDGQEYCGGGSQIVELTQDQYDALPDTKNTDNILYAITDCDELSAENMSCKDASGNLSNVQDELDKNNIEINKLNIEINKLNSDKIKVMVASPGSFTIPGGASVSTTITWTDLGITQNQYIGAIVSMSFTTNYHYLTPTVVSKTGHGLIFAVVNNLTSTEVVNSPAVTIFYHE